MIQPNRYIWSTMCEDFDALLKNSTWILVSYALHTNIVVCCWVFHIKKNLDGYIVRYRARIVAKGFHQHLGIDFHETFSHVVKPTTV